MKSNVSDLTRIALCVYQDACAWCPVDVSDLRDEMTISARVEAEGASFLTLTLPQFAKDFERSLADGVIDPNAFRSFRKAGAIPAFLQGMLGQLFNRETGRLHEETNDASTYVDAVRQVCLFFKKVELPCTRERESAAVENFVSIEQQLKDFSIAEDKLEEFERASVCLWPTILGSICPDSLVPRHGPGATAERVSGNQKYVWERWHERLEPFFPFYGFALPVRAYGERDAENVTFVPEEEEQPVRVTLVPKTLKAPRVIAIEPVCMQYVQQAIRERLYSVLESHWLTAGHLNFRNQSVNQALALESSSTGQYATIDLSDASDRVYHALAMRMFQSHPALAGAIDACRSRRAELPDGRIVGPLVKFASMGSALCFPIEAMYFYTICVVALCRSRNLPITMQSVKEVSRDIFVYGDDLIVPAAETGTVLEYLQQYNCKVNQSKSFWTGKFRESCGLDAYAGRLVTPVYLRRMRPENRQAVTQLISWVATANSLSLKGYERTASLMFSTCERILRGKLPWVSPESESLGRVSILGYRTVERRNPDLQRGEHRGWVPEEVYRSDGVDGYSALQKCLLMLEQQNRSFVEDTFEPTSPFGFTRVRPSRNKDERHLERSVLRGAATLKRRWVRALP